MQVTIDMDNTLDNCIDSRTIQIENFSAWKTSKIFPESFSSKSAKRKSPKTIFLQICFCFNSGIMFCYLTHYRLDCLLKEFFWKNISVHNCLYSKSLLFCYYFNIRIIFFDFLWMNVLNDETVKIRTKQVMHERVSFTYP